MSMFDISEMVYALYKQNWIDEHTTKEIRLQNIREYYSYLQECSVEDEIPDSYEHWLLESGFHGSLYVCYDEFCIEEYCDKEYVRFLLCGNEDLMELYLRDSDSEVFDGENCDFDELDFADVLPNMSAYENKSSLDQQIHSASIRVTDTQAPAQQLVKTSYSEHNL